MSARSSTSSPSADSALSIPARFERPRRVGSGRFGEVFHAFDASLGIEVALKRLLRVDARTLRSLRREVEALSDRRHPNLVSVHELVGDSDGLWLVLEWIPGEPLSRWAGQDADRWRLALPQLVAGLEALHELGYVHRDLDGENVRVTPDERMVLLDLGLASPRGVTDLAFGRLHAIAPEQVAAAPAEPAIDWYALGAMLFSGLAGRPPFEGRGAQVLARKRVQSAPPLASVAPDAPSDLCALVDALLRRDPEARMQEATPLLRAFGARAARDLPFVGREAELAQLEAALERLPSRGPHHVRLVGPPGIGKSALLRRFASRRRVFLGRAFEAHAYPFAGLDAVVEQLLEASPSLDLPRESEEALARVRGLASATTLDPERAFELAADALRLAVTQAATDDPVVLALDDVQWVDRDAIRLLASALRGTRALLVTSARPGDDTATLDALLPPSRLPVLPLGATALEALAGSTEGGARLADATGGVPLFAVTMVRGGEGASLEEALRARLAQLPAAEARMAALLSVAGRPLSRAIALEAATRSAIAHGESALRGLRAERLVQLRAEDEVRVELAHGALGRAAHPDEPTRALLHAALDDAMERLELDEPESQARHALGAGRPERAGRLFERAATRAYDALAFEQAATLAEEALVLAPERARALHALRGRALAAAGRGADAAEAYARALDGRAVRADDPETIELARRRAEQWLHAGRTDEGYAALDELLRAVDLALPSPRGGVARLVGHQLRMRWRLPRHRGEDPRVDRQQLDVCYSVGLALTNVDSFRGASFLLRSVWMAERADRERFARSLAYVAAYSCNGGRRTAALATRLIAAAEEVAHDPYSAATVVAARCLFAFHAGRFDESLARAAEVEARYGAIPGAVRERVTARIYRCASLAMRGEWDALEEARARLRRDGEARGDRFALVNVGSGPLNLGWLARGEPERARADAEESIACWTDVAVTVQHAFDLLAQARIDLYEGDAERAIARLDAGIPTVRRAFLFRMPFVKAHLLDLRARAELTRARPEPRLISRTLAALRAERASWIDPMADVLEAGWLARRGQKRDALERLERARAGYEAHGMSGYAEAARVSCERLGGDVGSSPPSVADPTRFARALGVVVDG